jgi:GTP-binding protein SAR1
MDFLSYFSSWFDYFLSMMVGFQDKEASLIVIGLDNAGKTTLLHRLQTGTVRQFTPTERVNEQKFEIAGVKFQGFDLGGHDAVRHLWEEYYLETDAIIFMVDCTDVRRFEEAKEELEEILDYEAISGIPIVILSNKVDRKDATHLDDVVKAIGLDEMYHDNKHDKMDKARQAPIKIFETSVLKGMGIEEAFKWLSENI